MSNQASTPTIIKETREAASGTRAEGVEPRQVTTTDDMHPDPSKSIKLPPNRQALLDDVIALYSCEPTIERVSRYAPNCAGQWFALPKLFPASKNESYEVIKNEPTLIQYVEYFS
ncbi:hypothetical protein QFC24_000186 [Naganishia onofrii]|uniref:Uncharacterized protein n=1 Tax=Naganishia onofrii TaxID=1851511 RepID=A0ACC2XXL2_9TREE|nr:hypothetical protein QFC24_000186 [Naganishia onofrii]